MQKQKIIIIIGAFIILAGILSYWYLQRSYAPAPVSPGAVGATEAVSSTVPEIPTNPGEKIPELNPVDRVNPFKYQNPLR